jgi:hypothetical protein
VCRHDLQAENRSLYPLLSRRGIACSGVVAVDVQGALDPGRVTLRDRMYSLYSNDLAVGPQELHMDG